MNPGSPADALPAFQLRNDPGGDRGNELVSKPARKIPFHRPAQPLQMVCTGILSGCIYGILLETTKCTVFFFFSFLLFKADGSESEQSAVTPAEIYDDLEKQTEKGGLCQPVAWRSQPSAGSECHTWLSPSRGTGGPLDERKSGDFRGMCVG